MNSCWDTRYAARTTWMRASEIRELLKLLDKPGIISFAGGIPDPTLFPVEDISHACQDILTETPETALQYSVSEGYRPLREWLVRLMEQNGIPCGIDNIIITSGSQQALDYLGKLFLSPGDTMLTTWPVYLGALQAFNSYEPRYDRLPLCETADITPQTLVKVAQEKQSRIACAYITPDFSNPSGESVTLDTRNMLLDIAAELNIPLIEDLAYQTLRFDGESLPPLLALDTARHGGDIERTNIIYCGSFSKILTPGLRVGWVCAARPVISKLVLIKQAGDLHCPTINQIVTHRIASTLFERQVSRTRTIYRTRRDAMLKALACHMPKGVSWTRPEGGMFVWVTLPVGMDAALLLEEAIKRQNIAFVPGKAFHPDGSGQNTLRLSYSLSSPEQIETGISRLGALLSQEIAIRNAAQ